MSHRDFRILYIGVNSHPSGAVAELLSDPCLDLKSQASLHGRLMQLRPADALACLRGEAAYSGQRRPDLVLLDLPGEDRLGLLGLLKRDEALRRIPVVVLGPNAAPNEVRAAYDCLANCYVIRPETPEQFLRLLEGLEEFWFTVAKLPAT